LTLSQYCQRLGRNPVKPLNSNGIGGVLATGAPGRRRSRILLVPSPPVDIGKTEAPGPNCSLAALAPCILGNMKNNAIAPIISNPNPLTMFCIRRGFI